MKDKAIVSEINNVNETHYYGQIKTLNENNDISYLNRGSVFYLSDKRKNPNSCKSVTKHPYIVLQSTYCDKVALIAVFSISSVPSKINMIPIVMKGTIGYIDPHKPYYYSVREFFSPSAIYIGTVCNEKVLDLVGNLYGMHLGLKLAISYKQVIQEYIAYVDEFNERSLGIERYEHKTIQNDENHSARLELKISFTTVPMDMEDSKTDLDDSDYSVIDMDSNDTDYEDDEIVDDEESEVHDTTLTIKDEVPVVKDTLDEPEVCEELIDDNIEDSESASKKRTRKLTDKQKLAINLYNSGVKSVDIMKETGYTAGGLYKVLHTNDVKIRYDRKVIEIDSNNQAYLSAISALENLPVGEVKFSCTVAEMTDDEIAILFLYVHLNSIEDAALLYNCATNTIRYRMNKLRERYIIKIS